MRFVKKISRPFMHTYLPLLNREAMYAFAYCSQMCFEIWITIQYTLNMLFIETSDEFRK